MFSPRFFACAFVLILSALSGAAQTSPSPPTPRPDESPPRPSRRNDGPWNRDLVAFDSSDGVTFTNRRRFIERAGVPCVMRDAANRLVAVFQWFPFERQEAFDKVAVIFSTDEGKTWTRPEPIKMNGLPERAQRPFDPTLVLLDDKRLRLYFTCTTPARRTPGIYSAISSNGVDYVFEPDMRFGVEGLPTVDAAVARLGKVWHLISPSPGDEPRGFHAVSDDGLNFRRIAYANLDVHGSWIGNLIARDQELWFYGSGGSTGWLARWTEGADWKLVSENLRVGGDPTVVKLRNGRYLLIATGEKRADAGPPPFAPAAPPLINPPARPAPPEP